jgi:hypothetical protein
MSNVKFVSSIEAGSKWRALVHQPYGSDLSQGECVTVNSFFTNGTLLFSDNRKSLWHGNVQTWKEYFEPYVEEKPMNEITVGSKWVAKEDRPHEANIRTGTVVTVVEVDDVDITYCEDGDELSWYADPKLWHDNFEPYVEVQEGFTLGDNVNNPSHYGQGKIEAIEYISDFLTKEEYQGYLRGNIAKYLHRFPYKNGIEDLRKAQWYLERLIQEVE